MFNQEIVDMLEQKFGRKHAVIFCQMEAMKNELIAKDMKEKGVIEYEPFDFKYDALWWESKGNELRKTLIG
jgi:hypothetical protein